MANLFFEFDYVFEAPPQIVWDALVDWKGHEKWIFATHVVLHGDGTPTDVGAEFTAWSGLLPTTRFGQRLSLQDHMRVAELHFDAVAESGTCRVDKLGPTLGGWAGFTVGPTGTAGTADSPTKGTRMDWTEDVTVRYLPAVLAPLVSRVAILGFRFFMGRLARQLPATTALA